MDLFLIAIISESLWAGLSLSVSLCVLAFLLSFSQHPTHKLCLHHLKTVLAPNSNLLHIHTEYKFRRPVNLMDRFILTTPPPLCKQLSVLAVSVFNFMTVRSNGQYNSRRNGFIFPHILRKQFIMVRNSYGRSVRHQIILCFMVKKQREIHNVVHGGLSFSSSQTSHSADGIAHIQDWFYLYNQTFVEIVVYGLSKSHQVDS